jgi:hypothetical protein
VLAKTMEGVSFSTSRLCRALGSTHERGAQFATGPPVRAQRGAGTSRSHRRPGGSALLVSWRPGPSPASSAVSIAAATRTWMRPCRRPAPNATPVFRRVGACRSGRSRYGGAPGRSGCGRRRHADRHGRRQHASRHLGIGLLCAAAGEIAEISTGRAAVAPVRLATSSGGDGRGYRAGLIPPSPRRCGRSAMARRRRAGAAGGFLRCLRGGLAGPERGPLVQPTTPDAAPVQAYFTLGRSATRTFCIAAAPTGCATSATASVPSQGGVGAPTGARRCRTCGVCRLA